MVTRVGSVVDSNEILIDDTRFPLKSPPRRTLTSLYAPKIVIGDTSRENLQNASSIAWSDWRGGIGIERGLEPALFDRAWWSTAQLRYDGHLILPRLATETPDVGASGGSSQVIGELGQMLYVAFGAEIYRLENDGTWSSLLHTLSHQATDVITFRQITDDTVYLVFLCGTHYTYTSDGTTWVEEEVAGEFAAFWNDELYMIDDTGQLRHNVDITALTEPGWTNDAKLWKPDNYVTNLFVARAPTAEFILYAMTKEGLFAHDTADARFTETDLALPFHPAAGLGTTRWRDSVFIGAGLGIYRYQVGGTGALVTNVGPDRNHGLPANRRGVIRTLTSSHNELIAIVDAPTVPPSAAASFTTYGGRLGNLGGHRTSILSQGSGVTTILGWDESGWEVKWAGTSSGGGRTTASVSSAYGEYRLWWGKDGRIFYMPLSIDITNPSQVANFPYARRAEHLTPDYDGDDITSQKLGLELRVETEGCSEDEKVEVFYEINRSGEYTYIDTITTNGMTTIPFPSHGTPEGVEFRSIRFRLLMERGNDQTRSPDVTRLEFKFRKKLLPKWGWQVTVSLTSPEGRPDYKGLTPLELENRLDEITQQTRLVPMTYKDQAALGAERTYYVDIVQASGFDHTGQDNRWERQITLLEP